jgi:hypothetical protein
MKKILLFVATAVVLAVLFKLSLNKLERRAQVVAEILR